MSESEPSTSFVQHPNDVRRARLNYRLWWFGLKLNYASLVLVLMNAVLYWSEMNMALVVLLSRVTIVVISLIGLLAVSIIVTATGSKKRAMRWSYLTIVMLCVVGVLAQCVVISGLT